MKKVEQFHVTPGFLLTTFQFCRRASLQLFQLTLERPVSSDYTSSQLLGPCWVPATIFSLALKVTLKRYIFIPFHLQLRLREQGHLPKATWLEVAVVRPYSRIPLGCPSRVWARTVSHG